MFFFCAVCSLIFVFFTELREKRSKLDQPEKLLSCSKSYRVLLKTWTFLFVRAILFKYSDFKLFNFAIKCKQIGPLQSSLS